MTKAFLDKEYTRLYPELTRYALGALRTHCLGHEPDLIVADAYLHLHNMMEAITDAHHLESIAKNYIKMNIQWWNSPYRRLHRGSENLPILGAVETTPLLDLSDLPQVTEDFISTLSTRERRLFNIYTVNEYRKGRDVAQYLGISISGAYILIHEAIEIENRYRQWCINKLTL